MGFKKGNNSWKNKKNFKHSVESIKRIKIARKKQIITPEHKKAISLATKGGNKTSFKKGVAPWNKGVPKEKSHMFGRVMPKEQRIKIGLKQKGEKNHAWRGGITPLRGKIYNTFEWRQWRSDIFNRDNFSCVLCGIRGGRLEADHIKAFSIIIKENNIKTVEDAVICAELWDINNGRTLCRPCHLKTENYGNRKK